MEANEWSPTGLCLATLTDGTSVCSMERTPLVAITTFAAEPIVPAQQRSQIGNFRRYLEFTPAINVAIAATSFLVSASLHFAKRIAERKLKRDDLAPVAADPPPATHKDYFSEQVELDRKLIEAGHISAAVDPFEVDSGRVSVHSAILEDRTLPVQRLL